MRNWFKTTMAAIAVILMTGLSTSVLGVASFARQTGLDCTSCHSELGFPTLNSFGAAFKAGGYTTGADENFIGDGEELTIPANLNFSGVIKFRYVAKKKVTDNAGTTSEHGDGGLELPDEGVLFVGGRAGKNIGWVVEAPHDAWAAFRIAFVSDLGGMKLGIVPFWTDGHGPGWSMETLSTGNAKHLRAAEIKESVSGQAATSWGMGGQAHGLGVYLWSPMFFLNVAAVNHAGSGSAGGNGTDGGQEYGYYIRGAVTPSFGGLEAGIGFTYLTGTTTDVNATNTAAPTSIDTAYDYDHKSIALDYMAIDAQIQGNVGIPLGAYITYATNKSCNLTETAVAGKAPKKACDTDAARDLTAFSVFVEAGVIPGKLQIGAGYMNVAEGHKGGTIATGAKGSASITAKATETPVSSDVLITAKYFFVRNFRLQAEYAMNLETGANAQLLMLFGSF